MKKALLEKKLMNITDPDNRESALSKKLLIEGIEKYMKNFFNNNKEKDEIFLCSTLHRDNLSSKYVSEFFGLKDSLFVKRRDGRNREVHICRIKREEYEKYLLQMRKKIAVLYGDNPKHLPIGIDEKIDILKEQLKYEYDELKRLRLEKSNKKNYTGAINHTKHKLANIIKLKTRITEEIKNKNIERSI